MSVLLAVLVIAAAGLGGTAHFTGARWFPHLGGGRTSTPPKPPKPLNTPTPPTGRPVRVPAVGVPTWLVLSVIAVILVAVALVLLRWWRMRPAAGEARLHAARIQTVRPTIAEPDPEPEQLLTGIELALQVLDEQRDPADAVVRAWLGLQETAEQSGIVRLPSETPTEFTSRILRAAFTDDRALRTLLRLYLRTRFGDHPVTVEDVAAVRAALRQLLGSWRQPDGATPSVR